MPSPQVTVSDNGGAPVDPVASGVGVNVTAGHAIVIQLQNLAANDWSCSLVGKDDLVATPTFTLDPVGKNVTFTAPTGPFALLFESVVNDGIDLNENPVTAYRQRFAIYALATGGFRVLAANERNEGSTLFGWIVTLNTFIRLLAGGATGDDTWQTGPNAPYTITGTVGTQVVDLPAAFTAPRTYTMPTAPTDGMKAGVSDTKSNILTNSGNTLTLTTAGGTDHFWVDGIDKGTSYVVDATLFKGSECIFRRKASDNTWRLT